MLRCFENIAVFVDASFYCRIILAIRDVFEWCFRCFWSILAFRRYCRFTGNDNTHVSHSVYSM